MTISEYIYCYLTARKEKSWIDSNGLGEVSHIRYCWIG